MFRILFIGRFQPFHLGHFSVIKYVIDKCDELIIAIGSAEKSYQIKNPFTCSERIEMISRVLKVEKIPIEKVHIIPIRDINDDNKWVDHVKKLCPEFHLVYTGKNPGYEFIQNLFQKSGIKTNTFENIYDIESTLIREKILYNDGFEKLLHNEVIDYLNEIKGIERIKKINKLVDNLIINI